MRLPPSNAVLWFGVLGGPCAWVLQFATNVFLGFAQCNVPPGRWTVPLHALQIIVSAAGVAIGVAAGVISLRLYVRTSNMDHVAAAERAGEGSPPPVGRINFLAMIGITVSVLALAIMIMTGIGAPLLPVCQQS